MCSADLSLEDWWNNSLAGLSKENRRSKVRGVASMGQGALAPLPPMLSIEASTSSLRNFGTMKRRKKEKRGRSSAREKREGRK